MIGSTTVIVFARQWIHCVLVGGILSLFPAFARAETPLGTPNDQPVATIKLLKGSQKTLQGPLTIKGDLLTEDYTITRLEIGAVQRMEREQSQAAKQPIGASRESRPDVSVDSSLVTWLLSSRHGDKSIAVQCPNDASISGEGEWGKETIRFGDILAVDLAHVAKPVPFKNDNPWRCTFASGATRTIDINSWEFKRLVTGRVLDAEVALDPSKVRKVVRDNEAFTVSCVEGLDIGPLTPIGKQISGRCPFGHIRIVNRNLDAIAPLTPTTSSNAAKTSSDERLPMTVRSVGGLTFIGWISELRVGDIEVALSPADFAGGPVVATDGTWTFAMQGNKRLSFRPADDTIFSGSFSAGTFKLSVRAIEQLAIRDPLTNKTDRVSSDETARGWIEDRHGNRLELLGDCSLSGGSLFDLHYPRSPFHAKNLLVLPGLRVRYGVDGAALFRYSVKCDGDSLEIADSNGATLSLPLGQRREFQGKTLAGKLKVAYPNVSAFEWKDTSGDKPSFLQSAACRATINVRGGAEIPVGTLAMSCRNTLKPGWRANGRLYRYTVRDIPVKHDGGVTSIELTKLKEIRPSENYRDDHQVTFVSRSGNTLVGCIDLEAIKKSTNQTYLSDEGIAAELGPGIYVFVNFADIDSVKLKAEQQSQ